MVTEEVIFEQAVLGWVGLVSLIAVEGKIRVFQQG